MFPWFFHVFLPIFFIFPQFFIVFIHHSHLFTIKNPQFSMAFSTFSAFSPYSSSLPWTQGGLNPTVTKLLPGTMDAGGIEPERHEIAQRYITLKKAPQNPLLSKDLFYLGPLRAVLPPSDSPINFKNLLTSFATTTQPCLSAGFRNIQYYIIYAFHIYIYIYIYVCVCDYICIL